MTQAICNSFKQEILTGDHDLVNDDIKVALYTNAATLNASTTVYSATNEVSGTGYTAAGKSLTTKAVTLDTNTAVYDADDITWTASSFTTSQALVYNATATNKAIGVLDFAGDITVNNGDFTLALPNATAAEGFIRVA